MVRILCVDISGADQAVYEALFRKASPERRKRAEGCFRMEDKLRCIAADVLLQKALGTDDYRVGKEEGGKPCILGRGDFHYNLSHSGDYVVIAFGGSRVGVDVQQHRARTDRDAVMERHFTSDEKDYILQDPARAMERFYEIWTGKESYLKYTGTGLRRDLRSFSVLQLEVRRFLCDFRQGYSLSLCTTEEGYTLEQWNVQQLL